MHIGVVGAGVIGITTALELQQEFRNAKVSIIADRFGTDTTSAVAAGIFRPGTSFCGPTVEVTKKWISDAYYHWDTIRKSEEAANAGICQLSGYIFSSTSPAIVRNHFLEKLLPFYRTATEDELKLCPGDWKYGSFFTTLVTEFRSYQPWASRKFTSAGGNYIQMSINDLKELQGKYDIVINCTGLGAKELCNDNKLVPIRGQVIKVKAPWIKTAFYGDYDTYIIPGFEGVTLGGCRQYDSYNTKPCKYDSAAIRERCENLLPSLVGAPVIREAVGLRPHRDPVRVEIEFIETPKGLLKVVHNYGHGGYGVTTAPGTAKYAAKLVRDIITGYSRL